MMRAGTCVLRAEYALMLECQQESTYYVKLMHHYHNGIGARNLLSQNVAQITFKNMAPVRHSLPCPLIKGDVFTRMNQTLPTTARQHFRARRWCFAPP